MVEILFMLGLDRLDRDDEIVLLAQLNAFTSLNVMGEGLQKGAKKAKDFALRGAKWAVDKVSPGRGVRVDQFRTQLDWDPNVLHRRVEQEIRALSTLTAGELEEHLDEALARVAGIPHGPAGLQAV
jgi:hypothetical protein